MSTRLLDANHDIQFLDGTIVLTDGVAEVVQEVETRLKLFLGEWFLDIEDGVPYFQTILKKAVDLPAVASILKLRILQTPDVARLITFDMDFDKFKRELIVKFTAETIDEQLIDVVVSV